MKNYRLRIFGIIIAIVGVIATLPVNAGRVEPRFVSCYFFRGENISLRNKCIFESTSWMGGGNRSLRWEDGVTTKMSWGLVGRGTKVCEGNEVQVDGVCGKLYYRSGISLNRISNSNFDEIKDIYCVQLKQKSICWKY